MTALTEAIEALRAALDAKDVDTVKALHGEYQSLLWTYNPNWPSPTERTFETLMTDANRMAYPPERCAPGAHLDDCLRRCGQEG